MASWKRLLAPVFAVLLAFPMPEAMAQTAAGNAFVVGTCGTAVYVAGQSRAVTQDINGNACSAASVSASISGFTAASTGTPISVTTGGVTGTLPAGAVVVATNVGTTNGAYCALGASASTSSQYISPNGGWFAFTVGASTQLTCITSTSTTTVNTTGGAGLPTGTGGGGGGGSGGTVAQGTAAAISAGWPITAGEPNDTTGTFTNGTQTGNVATASVDGYASAIITIHGTYGTATATFLASDDGGTTLYPLACTRIDGSNLPELGYTTLTNTSRAWLCATQGFDVIEVLSSAVASGTVNVRISQSAAPIQAPAQQAISASSLPLPTGASTSALQPTNAAQGSTTSGQTGHLMEGAVTTAAPAYTTAQTSPLSLDTAGNLRVNVIAGGGTGGTSVAQGSTTSGQNVSPAGCATTTSAPTNTTAQTNMLNCDTTGSLRVNVTSATGVAQGSTTSGQSISPIGCRTLTSAPTDTTAQSNIPWCSTKGSLVVAQPTAADLNVTAALAAGSNTIGGVSPVAAATGGATHFTLTAAASTNYGSIKGSAGTLYHVSVYNNSATPAYLTFFDSASATPTCTGTQAYQVGIPANSTSMAGAVEDISIGGAFTTGIGYCVTTGIGGTGSVAATTYTINAWYK